ncbi:MAG: hypothetical protein KDI79_06530 [Anaerolineae bacterium]|nr:hypothetical protein [Anaerolineae bacterium]
MTTAPPSSMRAFAEAFFTHFGAPIEAGPDELIVELPDTLATHFGRPRLYLVFPTGHDKPRDLSPHEDVLVYGSRIFERMLALLDGQGELARLAYPRQVVVALETELKPSLRRPEFRLVETAVDDRQPWVQIFNFRVTYRSDEKEEMFETIVLDANGRPDPAAEALIRSTAPLADPPEPSPALEPQPEQAAALMRQRAADHAAKLQQSMQTRLEKVLLRLTGFYRRLMAEIDTGQPDQAEQARADLQQELDRKIADELERHQLHLNLTPISTAVALLPFVHYRLAIGDQSRPDPANPLTGSERLATPYEGSPPPAINAVDRLSRQWNRYRWQVVASDDYTIYLGHHWLWGLAVLVLDYNGTMLHQQQVGWGGSSR